MKHAIKHLFNNFRYFPDKQTNGSENITTLKWSVVFKKVILIKKHYVLSVLIILIHLKNSTFKFLQRVKWQEFPDVLAGKRQPPQLSRSQHKHLAVLSAFYWQNRFFLSFDRRRRRLLLRPTRRFHILYLWLTIDTFKKSEVWKNIKTNSICWCKLD